MTSLRNDERGFTFVQLAAIIIAPLIVLVIASVTISVVRTGAGLTDLLTRTSQTQLVVDAFKDSIGSSSTLEVESPTTIVATIDPGALPPTLEREPSTHAATCVTSTWTLTGDGALRTVTETRQTHESTCESPVIATVELSLTGLTEDTGFTIRNRAGRELTAGSGGGLVAVAGSRPEGVSTREWDSTAVGAVTLAGAAQDLLTDRDVRVTAFPTPSR